MGRHKISEEDRISLAGVLAETGLTQMELADLLGIRKQAVNNWHARGVPIRWALKIIELTDAGAQTDEQKPENL